MFSFEIVDFVTNNTFTTLSEVSPDSYSEPKLKMFLNQPHELILQVNLNFPYWKEFQERNSWGLRYKTYPNGELLQDIVFIRYEEEIKDYGVLELRMYSFSKTLEHNFREVKDLYYSGSLATFLSYQDSRFEFTAISDPKDTVIETGVLTNLDIITEAIRYPDFFALRENGIIDLGGGNYKCQILYGNFGADISTYYSTSGDERCANLSSFNGTTSDNDDLDLVSITSLRNVFTRQNYRYILPVGDVGNGSALSNSIRLSNPNASYISPQFPLVSIPNSFTGVDDWYIQNPYAVGIDRVKEYIYTYSTSSYDADNTQNISDLELEEILYKRSVSYIQALNSSGYFDCEVGFKKVVLPGNAINVEFYQEVDGVVIFDINSTFILNEIEYDLNRTIT